MTNEELNAIRKGYLDAVTADHLMIPWSIRWVVQQVPGLVSEVERLTQERDQARAVCETVFNYLATDNTYSPALNQSWKLLSEFTGKLQSTDPARWDEKPREDTPK